MIEIYQLENLTKISKTKEIDINNKDTISWVYNTFLYIYKKLFIMTSHKIATNLSNKFLYKAPCNVTVNIIT
jgi:hypothetical protein